MGSWEDSPLSCIELSKKYPNDPIPTLLFRVGALYKLKRNTEADFILAAVCRMYNLRNLAKGLIDYMSKDYKKAMSVFKHSKHCLAQYLMGRMYLYTHKDIVQDNSKAVEWLQLSADLGTCYDEGWGVRKDLGEASKLYPT
jgi:TPR repeat protein